MKEELLNTQKDLIQEYNVDYWLQTPLFSLKINKHPENSLIFKIKGKYDETIGYNVLFNENHYTWRYDNDDIKNVVNKKIHSYTNKLTLKNIETI